MSSGDTPEFLKELRALRMELEKRASDELNAEVKKD